MSWGDILIADGYTDQSDSVATLMHSPNVVASDVSSILSASMELPYRKALSWIPLAS